MRFVAPTPEPSGYMCVCVIEPKEPKQFPEQPLLCRMLCSPLDAVRSLLGVVLACVHATRCTPWDGGTRTAALIAGGLVPLRLRGSQSHVLLHIADW